MRSGTALTGVAALPAPWRDDPLLAGEHATSHIARWWADDEAALVLVEPGGRPPAALGIGSGAAVAGLLGAVAAADDGALLRTCASVTVPRGTREVAGPDAAAALSGLTGDRSTWDWMCTDRPLTGADPGAAVRLPPGPATVEAVARCLERAHPDAGTAPDDPRALGWWGIGDGDRLAAVVGAVLPAHGPTPRLVALGVDPDARGRGLAGVVLAAAVRDLLDAHTGRRAVSIALYADNHVARRVYLRHGFVLRHGFETRRRPA